MGKKGFTLIELLAVITILAIILTITIPILLKVIKDSKNTVGKDSLELYGRSIENAVASYYTKYPQKNEVTLQELKQEKLLDYKGKEITCEQVEIYERDVYLANCKAGDKPISTTYGKPIFASTNKDYSGYYADVDSDGTVDGVIYADLAHSKSEDFYNDKTGVGQGHGTYSYEAKTNLNEYTVSNNTYKKNDGFGENKIIKLKKDKNNPRFYVMALEDFRTGSFEEENSQGCAVGKYLWYYNAYAKMDATDTSLDFGTGYTNTGNIIRIWNAGESGKYNAGQNEYDIWGKIQSEYAKGWYIPSRGEWAAFGDYFKKRTENKLTHDRESGIYVYNSGNYNSLYGLSDPYWSSSQAYTYRAWSIYFGGGGMYRYDVGDCISVRLGATF